MLSIQSDDHYMSLALLEAQKAFDSKEIPVGAVVVAGHKVIAKTHNQVQRLNDVTAHAEMLAITAAQNYLGSKYLDECTLYVTLEPCTMCAGALYWAQINKLVIGANDEKRGFSSVSPAAIHPKTTLITGIKSAECGDLVKSFFERMRRNNL